MLFRSDPELLAHNVNRWLQRVDPAQRMLRTLDGHARAFLSSRYRRIDNYDVARIVTPVVGEMPDIQFGSCELTEDYMYLKVVNPRLQDEVRPGDVFKPGCRSPTARPAAVRSVSARSSTGWSVPTG